MPQKPFWKRTNQAPSIRPLFTDDLRQRRVSGRHQISNDGKHLIDGLAFGRPLLKTPRGRPALDIPPRKRRRVSLEDMDMDADEENDADYDHAEEDLEPMLLLTNGEEELQERRKSVRIATDFENMDADTGSGNDQEEEHHEQSQDDISSEQSSDSDGDDEMEYEQDVDEEDDLAKELEDLQNADLQNSAEEDYERGKDQDEDQDEESADDESGPTNQLDSAKVDDPISKTHFGKVESGAKPKDKIGTLLTAFPTAPVQVCREVLAAEVGDLQKSYLTLSQAFEPKVPESELLKRWRGRDDQGPAPAGDGLEAPNDEKTAENGADDDDDQDEDDDEDDEDENDDVTPFIRRFDRQGLPPGSISSGNALDAMAAMSKSFTNGKSGSNGMSTPQHLTNRRITFDDQGNVKTGAEEESETSSSGTSSSSEEVEASSDDEASDDSTSDEEQPQGNGDADGHGPEDSDTSSSSGEDSDSDSAPEERSAKEGATVHQKAVAAVRAAGSPTTSSSSSSEDSDADDETSSDSSDENSSDNDSSDSKDVDVTDKPKSNSISTPATSTTLEGQAQPLSKSDENVGIPGSGSISTKKRNARRRLAAKNQKMAQPQSQETTGLSTTDSNTTTTLTASSAHALDKSKLEREKELFEAKRKALLEAIANGGIEVGPGGDSALLDSPQASQKRKRDEPSSAKPETQQEPQQESQQEPQQEPPIAASAEVEVPTNVEEGSPSSAQKRRRLDLGAGRRMLFGALGLRNPKSKEDEEKLRTKLMKDVKPLKNARLAAEADEPKAETDAEVDEAPDAWREKITYRAVECCQEGVELSEPPFPFVQRWDPQQQNAWFQKNKRGGKGKKAARNQSHFYQQPDDRDNESYDYTETYEPVSRHAEDDVPMILNYDDVEQVDQDVEEHDAMKDADETTRLTDVDDLPSLPKNLDDLPPLRPGEAQNGMVITWKQFILSKATNWQPQVLSLAGVICRIDDDATGLEVMLAKRDRDLEQPEKQYDDFTGQRVYDKFDAPEIEDDAEDEETRRMNEGYRTLSFTNMMEPRILQPAISLEEAGDEPTIPSIEDQNEPQEPLNSAEIDCAPESQVEDATTGIDSTSELKDTTFEGFDDTILVQQNPPNLDATETKATTLVPNGAEQDSNSLVQGTTQHSSQDLGKAQSPAEIPVSDLSQVSSPSRQLHDETTSVLNGLSAGDEQSLGTSHDIPLTPLAAESADMTIPDSLQDHDDTSLQIHETDVITGTPRFTYPRPDAPPSSTSSVCSGRQLDLSMDLGVNQPESFQAMTDDSTEMINDTQGDFDAPDVAGEEDPTVTSNDEATTPVPPSPWKGDLNTPKKSRRSESPASTPCSLASLGTVWCTAATSRRTQSPSKSQMLSALRSQKSQVSNDNGLEYEVAMRKLDDFSDDEDVSQVSKIEDSFTKSSKIPVTSSSYGGADNDWNMGNDPDSDRLSSLPAHARTDVAISPPPTSRNCSRIRRQRIPPSSPLIKKRDSPQLGQRKSARVSSSTFSLPPGTQVLEISSDSDEPKFTENYADDDKDESYLPANDLLDHESSASLPRGSGWVKKTRVPKSSSAPVPSHKKAPKVNRAASTSQSSYSSQLKNLESAAAAMKRLNKERKASARL